MEQTEQQGQFDPRRYPSAWKKYLLETYPSGRIIAEPSHMRRHAQIHSTRRDEQGRFNDLVGGIPDWTTQFADDLQDSVDAWIIGGGVANTTPRLPLGRSLVETIDPFAIEAAIDRLKGDMPNLWAVLLYFQSPPGTRPWSLDEFASQLNIERGALYKRRNHALYAVWERLPIGEKLKAAGEP